MTGDAYEKYIEFQKNSEEEGGEIYEEMENAPYDYTYSSRRLSNLSKHRYTHTDLFVKVFKDVFSLEIFVEILPRNLVFCEFDWLPISLILKSVKFCDSIGHVWKVSLKV